MPVNKMKSFTLPCPSRPSFQSARRPRPSRTPHRFFRLASPFQISNLQSAIAPPPPLARLPATTFREANASFGAPISWRAWEANSALESFCVFCASWRLFRFVSDFGPPPRRSQTKAGRTSVFGSRPSDFGLWTLGLRPPPSVFGLRTFRQRRVPWSGGPVVRRLAA
jgi:hypothetical protein